ncbi:MAG: non-lysosomal glucosylceramidase [Chloroflexi bacterium]|nr:non-lysosomal glucosylceramidase [Chloroflexota bacterium]
MTDKTRPYSPPSLFSRGHQRTFRGRNLLQIAMPLGGIGAGSICLNGRGGLQDFSIRNQPATSAKEDGNNPGDAAFALLHLPGRNITRLIEGPFPIESVYNQGLKAQGNLGGGSEGLPRFRECSFKGEYPFGFVSLSDAELPLAVRIRGFNPFIPLDDKNSSLPCAILEYTLVNTSSQPVQYEFSYHLSHLAPGEDAANAPTSRSAAIPETGVFFFNEEDPAAASFGSAALGVVGASPQIKAEWFRGGWFDGISALWREVSTGAFQANEGSSRRVQGRNGGSILVKGVLDPEESATYPVVIAWYFPNVHYLAGGVETGGAGVFSGPAVRADHRREPSWRPYYTSQWQNAKEVLEYVAEHYRDLRSRTQAFHDALFASTLPPYVLDAVSANLAILKSPTVLRQENGNVWGWEGCFCERGCCYGSCTHVWNYAQSMPHLFPQLERTLREQELDRSMDEAGHINFRAALPDGPTHHSFHAAADGQLGGVMKVYREWQICGDHGWLAKMYPLVKRSMDYAIRTWDPKMKGVVEEPHHNTYDIEFWGPDGMHASFYLGALSAMAELARDAGHPQEASFYEGLAQKGSSYIDAHLYNGEYYEQKVIYRGLRDTSFARFVDSVNDESPAEDQLLKREGPKYQYASGCISDGVLGAWMALQCGVASTQSQEKVRSNLQAIFNHNFKSSLWDHANPQRPGFALGDEPGLLLCTWPRGGKPTLPFVYSDEVWTGIEYQVASHLISQGLVDEGLTVVKAVRSRYDGLRRNPWNEYECGSYYARAMSSYALLSALSGFRYSMPERKLYLAPKINLPRFECFFSTAAAYGTISLFPHQLEIDLAEGELVVDGLYLIREGGTIELHPEITARAGEVARIRFE